VFASDRDGNEEIYVLAADGAVARLTNDPANDEWPSLSPDGSEVVFDSERGGSWGLWVANADGTDARPLFDEPSAPDGIGRWSPDGSRIVFNSARDGDHDVYVIGSDGAGLTQLTNAPGYDGAASWSPDGAKIVFESERDGNSDVFVMNPDGTGTQQLTNQPFWESQPVYSPDGSQIAFSAYPSEAQGVELYVMNADGSGARQLTAGHPGFDGTPTWSPDGRLVATAQPNGDSDLYVVDPVSGALTPHLTGVTWDFMPNIALGAQAATDTVTAGTVTTETDEFPNAAEAALSTHVPLDFGTCQREYVLPEGSSAGLRCSAGSISVSYIQFDDLASLTDWYDQRVARSGAGRDTGDCVADAIAETAYTTGGVDAGRLLCTSVDIFGRFLVWTDDGLLIGSESVASDSPAERRKQFDFWANEAGPV
jgi:dipeptidyl aminopeptidase/acylaminoacyl peptidase